MPGIVSTSHPEVRDIRIVSVLGLGYDQCNVFLVSHRRPKFSSSEDALKWLDGKTVAVPGRKLHGPICAGGIQAKNLKPSNISTRASRVAHQRLSRAKKPDAAVIWEPTASRPRSGRPCPQVASGASSIERDGGSW